MLHLKLSYADCLCSVDDISACLLHSKLNTCVFFVVLVIILTTCNKTFCKMVQGNVLLYILLNSGLLHKERNDTCQKLQIKGNSKNLNDNKYQRYI